MRKTIRVAIFGVGNCAKSLVEGVSKYTTTPEDTIGLAFPNIGGYVPADIEFVLAYDVDARKVGKPLAEAIRAKPNCAVDIATWIVPAVCGTTEVQMGLVLDGVAPHMAATTADDSGRFFVDQDFVQPDLASVVRQLMETRTDVAVIYLPVGSEAATRFYVECLLAARVPFVNCIPVFIVSDPVWQKRIAEAGIPAIGDDMRSQVGASVLSQVLQEMFLARGAVVDFHCQTNAGGNTDFRNMLDRTRLVSKKTSKENVIVSQNILMKQPTPVDGVHAGPSDYIPYLKDNKVAHIRIEAKGFGGVPITLDCRLSVQDSPNSAGIVIDAVRYLRVAQQQGIVGPLYGVSAATQKTPPKQMRFSDAYAECVRMAEWKRPT